MKPIVVKKTLEKQLHSNKPPLVQSSASSLANTLCQWKTAEEEISARQQLSNDQLSVLRSQLPLILNGLKKIPDHRNPTKSRHPEAKK